MRVLDGIEEKIGRRLPDGLFQHDRIVVQPESAQRRCVDDNRQKRQLTGGDLLEIGCGYGYLLEEARGFFRTRTGLEMSHDAAAIASRRADRVYEGGLEQLPAGEKFDCIIATHVIEHVYDPL